MSPLGHLIAWPVESAARIKSTCKAVNLRWVYLPTNSRSLCAATPATIDIGAPGASVSAEAGTGTGQVAFGGTSGATPMISGSAALLIQAHPSFAPLEIKALLMNTAETNIQINPATQPGVLAPITRIGGGEVRVAVPPGFATRTFFVLADNHGVALRGLQRDDETLEELFYRVVRR